MTDIEFTEHTVVVELDKIKQCCNALRIDLKYRQYETNAGIVLEALGELQRAQELLRNYLLRGYR